MFEALAGSRVRRNDYLHSIGLTSMGDYVRGATKVLTMIARQQPEIARIVTYSSSPANTCCTAGYEDILAESIYCFDPE